MCRPNVCKKGLDLICQRVTRSQLNPPGATDPRLLQLLTVTNIWDILVNLHHMDDDLGSGTDHRTHSFPIHQATAKRSKPSPSNPPLPLCSPISKAIKLESTQQLAWTFGKLTLVCCTLLHLQWWVKVNFSQCGVNTCKILWKEMDHGSKLAGLNIFEGDMTHWRWPRGPRGPHGPRGGRPSALPTSKESGHWRRGHPHRGHLRWNLWTQWTQWTLKIVNCFRLRWSFFPEASYMWRYQGQ